MSLDIADPLTTRMMLHSLPRASGPSPERRKRARARVQWLVRFWGTVTAPVIETVTRDVSSEGFYCLSRVPLIPHETVGCSLTIPSLHPERALVPMVLECQVIVVRMDPPDEQGYFGIACRIEDYRLASADGTVD